MPRLIITIIIVALLGFWLAMFWDCANNPRLKRDRKYLWFACFIFFGALTGGWYYLTEYRRRF